MTEDTPQHDTDADRDAQGLPDEGPGSRSTPPSNPDAETGEADKGKEKLDRIVNW